MNTLPVLGAIVFAAALILAPSPLPADEDCKVQIHTSANGAVIFDCGEEPPNCDDGLPCELYESKTYPPPGSGEPVVSRFDCTCSNYSPLLDCDGAGAGKIWTDPDEGKLWDIECITVDCPGGCEQFLVPKALRHAACYCPDS